MSFEEEDGGVDDVEVVLERHIPQSGHRIDEAVERTKQRVCCIDGLVDEPGIGVAGHVGEDGRGLCVG